MEMMPTKSPGVIFTAVKGEGAFALPAESPEGIEPVGVRDSR